ncbi:hypothetical protein NEOLEDRAFT_546340 [Neolentinus lepideus HHB14362 ss-1]|uniref:Uncharacterized protein n=1 Tax=Neolentinus lepideus HHB14362 ss-1 TaxID=1314782 RepID=A0A165R804_9AGAM|nr:hypothetical protein NEOLEDRAFT_546340 [Neolentinus lepideus HHB14362 ss-1]
MSALDVTLRKDNDRTSVDKLSARLGRLSTISPSERRSLKSFEPSSSDVGVTEQSSASTWTPSSPHTLFIGSAY